jgi:hypothetical protein
MTSALGFFCHLRNYVNCRFIKKNKAICLHYWLRCKETKLFVSSFKFDLIKLNLYAIWLINKNNLYAHNQYIY